MPLALAVPPIPIPPIPIPPIPLHPLPLTTLTRPFPPFEVPPCSHPHRKTSGSYGGSRTARRVVPRGYESFGTWHSPRSTEYDLLPIVDYYNWRYKLPARLPGDRRPIWR